MDRYTNDAVGKKKDKPGIDVVLGSQWGDEGKGKLVDMLSQVRLSTKKTILFTIICMTSQFLITANQYIGYSW